MQVDDRALLQRAIDGDTRAIDSFLLRLHPIIERQLRRYPLTEEDQRDVLQITLIQIARRLHSFRGESSVSTWVYRIMSNEALMLMRAQRRQRTRLVHGVDLEDVDCLRTPSEGDHRTQGDAWMDKNEREAWVRTALADLSDEHRDVVFAHYHLDLGLHEIARRLDLTESAVRSRLHRARLRLRTLLERTPLGDEAREEGVSSERAA